MIYRFFLFHTLRLFFSAYFLWKLENPKPISERRFFKRYFTFWHLRAHGLFSLQWYMVVVQNLLLACVNVIFLYFFHSSRFSLSQQLLLGGCSVLQLLWPSCENCKMTLRVTLLHCRMPPLPVALASFKVTLDCRHQLLNVAFR